MATAGLPLIGTVSMPCKLLSGRHFASNHNPAQSRFFNNCKEPLFVCFAQSNLAPPITGDKQMPPFGRGVSRSAIGDQQIICQHLLAAQLNARSKLLAEIAAMMLQHMSSSLTVPFRISNICVAPVGASFRLQRNKRGRIELR